MRTLVIEHAAAGFSRLAPLLTDWPVERHLEKLARGRERLGACLRARGGDA